jgi:hypothetical protein
MAQRLQLKKLSLLIQSECRPPKQSNTLQKEKVKKMVTKEDVEKAKADYDVTKAYAIDAIAAAGDAVKAAEAALAKYTKLKREYENGIKSTED